MRVEVAGEIRRTRDLPRIVDCDRAARRAPERAEVQPRVGVVAGVPRPIREVGEAGGETGGVDGERGAIRAAQRAEVRHRSRVVEECVLFTGRIGETHDLAGVVDGKRATRRAAERSQIDDLAALVQERMRDEVPGRARDADDLTGFIDGDGKGGGSTQVAEVREAAAAVEKAGAPGGRLTGREEKMYPTTRSELLTAVAVDGSVEVGVRSTVT